MLNFTKSMNGLAPPDSAEGFARPRVNGLLDQAVRNPLVTVCARAGYGKTHAVNDFVRASRIPTAWIQFSQKDNTGIRFWENYVRAMGQVHKPLAVESEAFGFPDTEEKLDRYIELRGRFSLSFQYLVVFDDFHRIQNAAVIRFIERIIYDIRPNRSVVMICQELPQIAVAGLVVRGLVSNIGEEELNFTESELTQYLRFHGLSVEAQNLYEIYQDTKGWIFAISFIAQALKKSPGYAGYVRGAMRNNIFQLMEREVWDGISERLRLFLARLSLVDHFSSELIAILAGGDESLLAELNRQSAYIRRDNYTGAYSLHSLFLDFLRTKQEIISDAERRQTYQITADWCMQNNFRCDALSYYEKLGDYEAIASVLRALPITLPEDIVRYAVEMFARVPDAVFDRVACLAATHLRVVIRLGQWAKAAELAEHYQARYLLLPEDSAFRNHALSGIYYHWAFLRMLMCTTDDRYDFDTYYAKLNACIAKLSPFSCDAIALPNGPWFIPVGSARRGAPQECIDALVRAGQNVSHCPNIGLLGRDDLARGELLFYQGDTQGAESCITLGLTRAREFKMFDAIHCALLYMMRIAVFRGDYVKAERALKDIEVLINESDYPPRFMTHDIAVGWFYYALRWPERIPEWLQGKCESYVHAYAIENFANQIRARYFYQTNLFAPLLAYMEEQARRESSLYGRIERLAIKACVHYQTKDRPAAFATLAEAYECARPNDITMPFIELGKDMRTLIAAALREKDCAVPRDWLEAIGRKAATYAKYQALFISGYKKANEINEGVALSPREREMLRDLCQGLSRPEIASSQNMSINAVKLMVNSIYEKLNASNISDAIRIAIERKLV